MELHTPGDLSDHELLELTKWAQERCLNALRFGIGEGDGGECEAEVGVGVVRDGGEEGKGKEEIKVNGVHA